LYKYLPLLPSVEGESVMPLYEKLTHYAN
jgi:hypothetical protein